MQSEVEQIPSFAQELDCLSSVGVDWFILLRESNEIIEKAKTKSLLRLPNSFSTDISNAWHVAASHSEGGTQCEDILELKLAE